MPSRLGDCYTDSVLMSNGDLSSLESPVAALKKRPRPLFGNGESMPLDSNMRPVEWMMSHIV